MLSFILTLITAYQAINQLKKKHILNVQIENLLLLFFFRWIVWIFFSQLMLTVLVMIIELLVITLLQISNSCLCKHKISFFFCFTLQIITINWNSNVIAKWRCWTKSFYSICLFLAIFFILNDLIKTKIYNRNMSEFLTDSILLTKIHAHQIIYAMGPRMSPLTMNEFFSSFYWFILFIRLINWINIVCIELVRVYGIDLHKSGWVAMINELIK